jgi:4-hydroxy-L-threonine phosphate dehydrogenase PdxA
MQSLSIDRKFSDLPLAITMGEPGGINSEIFLKASKEINKINNFIICDPSWIEKSLEFFNKKNSINILDQNLNIKENYINIIPSNTIEFRNIQSLTIYYIYVLSQSNIQVCVKLL